MIPQELEFYDKPIVLEFAERNGWVKGGINWTPLFLSDAAAQCLHHMIEVHAALALKGRPATASQVLDAAMTLGSLGIPASEEELVSMIEDFGAPA